MPESPSSCVVIAAEEGIIFSEHPFSNRRGNADSHAVFPGQRAGENSAPSASCDTGER